MRDTEIIEALRSKLVLPSGRHLYGVLGTYAQLAAFAKKLQQVRTPDGRHFPQPLSVNRGILDAIPDAEFHTLVEDEAKRPEPTAAHVARAFEVFLRKQLSGKILVILAHLELLFAYHVEFSLLRTLAADDTRILLLLPGKREAGQIIMFPGLDTGSYSLPPTLIAENHLWELRE